MDHIAGEFGYWFSGLVAGDGCFFISHDGSYPRRRNITYRCHFLLTQRADDLPAIEWIAGTMGFGDTGTQERRKENPLVYWRVTRKIETLALCEFFDRYPLRTRKQADYEIWREAVLLWQDAVKGHGHAPQMNDHIWPQMAELMAALREHRRY